MERKRERKNGDGNCYEKRGVKGLIGEKACVYVYRRGRERETIGVIISQKVRQEGQ